MTDTNVIPLPVMKHIELEAAEWIMRLEDGDASAEDQAAFQAWYNKNEQNREAVQRLSHLWDGLDGLQALNDYAAADNTLVARGQDRASWLDMGTNRAWIGSIAASVVAVCCVVAYGLFFDAGQHFNEAYQTAIGEQQSVLLPDGSSIILNTNTAIEVEFSRNGRYVRLVKGEAFFDVFSDKKKPFSVRAGEGTATALGTAFSVYLYGETFDIAVTEGRVALAAVPAASIVDSRIQTSEPLVTELAAGQMATFDREVKQLDVIADEWIARRLDWRDGVLAFKGEPLEQVLADISRYTTVSIDIRDETLRQLPIAGYFKVGEIDGLFDALKIMADIDVEYINQNHVQLYRSD